MVKLEQTSTTPSHIIMSRLNLAASLLILALVAISSAYAFDCSDSECPAGFLLIQSFGSLNCTGDSSYFPILNNSVAGQCSTSSITAKAKCSASGMLTLDIYGNTTCAADSYKYSQSIPSGTCIETGGSSAVYWCNRDDIRSPVTKSVKSVATPITVPFPPDVNAQGQSSEIGCNASSPCSNEYATMSKWPVSNNGCSGNATSILPATVLFPGLSDGWYALDQCYISSRPSVGASTTAKMVCKDGQAHVTLYAGNCQNSAIVATAVLSSGQCVHTPDYYFRVTCPSGSAASALSFSGFLLVALFAVVALFL